MPLEASNCNDLGDLFRFSQCHVTYGPWLQGVPESHSLSAVPYIIPHHLPRADYNARVAFPLYPAF